MADEVERRLAAILSADVVSYSRLIRADEEGTLARLKAHREDLIHPKIVEHHGRIVKLMGDGELVEFSSVVDAVQCAVEIQRQMPNRNADIPEDQRIEFRIGINLGDVIVEDDDIYGDGVNIAARLEALADPGGVCIATNVFEQVRHRLELGFEDLGDQQVKNIPEPVRAYRVLLGPEAAGHVIGQKPARKRLAKRWRWAIPAAAVVVIGVAAGVLLSLEPWVPRVDAADPTKMAFPLPKKPSIAVLPFDNLTGDPEQDYLGDGLTENIIAVLSTSPDLFVIARNSSFAYKGEATKVQEVAEQLGVRYVLEGSVQQSGDKLRITAQLVDAIDGRHLWAERFDRSLNDLFELQDDITQLVLEAMHIQLTHGAQARYWREGAADPEVYRLLMQGLRSFETFSVDGYREAERLWSQAYKQQPEGRVPNTLMGWLHWQKVMLGLATDPAASFAQARDFAEKALALGGSAETHSLLATLDLYSRKHEAALAHADQALEMAPSYANTNFNAGRVMADAGQPARGVELMKLAMRLDPNYPPIWAFSLSRGHLMIGQFDESRVIAEMLTAAPIDEVEPFIRYGALGHLAIGAIARDDSDTAREYVKRMLALQPNANIAGYRSWYSYLRDQAFVVRYLEALRQAGLPENPPLPLGD